MIPPFGGNEAVGKGESHTAQLNSNVVNQSRHNPQRSSSVESSGLCYHGNWGILCFE